jgi:hypothetical protein
MTTVKQYHRCKSKFGVGNSDAITGKHPTNARAGLAPGTSDTITGKRPTNAAVGSVLLSSQMQGDCDLIAKEEDKGWMMMG